MVSHIAAAAGAVDRDFPRREYIRIVAAATEGVDMGMFNKQENVRK